MTVTIATETIQAAQGGDQDAMWEIITEHEAMLSSIVRQVAPNASPSDVEDLMQDARIELIQHVRSYNTDSSAAKLSTYAYAGVRKAVARLWVKNTTGLTIEPSVVHAVSHALWVTEGDEEGAWMIVSSNEDPRRRISREVFVSVREALAQTLSLSSPAGHDDDSMTLADTIPEAGATFTDTADKQALAHYLLSEIPPRQAFALRAFYAIGMEQMTDAQAGDDLGLKPAAVRVLRTRGVDNARQIALRDDLRAAA